LIEPSGERSGPREFFVGELGLSRGDTGMHDTG